MYMNDRERYYRMVYRGPIKFWSTAFNFKRRHTFHPTYPIYRSINTPSMPRYGTYPRGFSSGSRKKTYTKFRPVYPKRRKKASNVRTGGFVGIEKKFLDGTFQVAIVATVAGSEMDPPGAGAQTAPGTLSAIAQGDGESNRDGRKCTLTSLHLKGDVTLSPTSSDGTGKIVRVMIVWDKQTNGAQFNAEDVFLSNTNVEYSFRNLQFIKRFAILKDQTFVLVPQAASGDGTTGENVGDIKKFNWNFNFRIPQIYKGTTAVIANITDNSLHIMAFANATGTVLSYASRVRFFG